MGILASKTLSLPPLIAIAFFDVISIKTFHKSLIRKSYQYGRGDKSKLK